VADEFLYRRVGVTDFPFTAAPVLAAGGIVDKIQEVLLGLFSTAITSELQDAFQAASAPTPLAGSLVVADTWPGLLTPQVMKQRKAGFPLLSVGWLGSAEWSEHTLSIDKVTRKWAVDYVLGPLDVGSAQRLESILHKVGTLLQLTCRNRGHKSFRNGAVLWGSDTDEPISTIWWDSHEAGQASFGSDNESPIYYALSGRITTTEIDSDLDVYDDLTGASFTGTLDSSEVTIEAETEYVAEHE
jgi:hypothetical protein